MLSTCSAFLGVGPPLGRAAEAPGQLEQESRDALFRWLLLLRSLAVLGSGTVVALATLVEARVEGDAVPALWGGVLVLLCGNVAVWRLGPARATTQRMLALQVGGDVLILGWLVHHAGGTANPFSAFFVFHAVIGGIVLDAQRARRIGGAIAVFVLLLTLVEASGLLAPACVAGPGGACAARADFMAQLAAGAAISATVVGCAVVVVALVTMLRAERDRLEEATRTLLLHTEQLRAAQSEVLRERETLQTIIDCMADAVLFAAPDGAIRLKNRAAERLFGGTGRLAEGTVRACHSKEVWDRLLERATGTEPCPIEPHPVFEVGGRSFEATYAPARTPDGAFDGVVMVARDVTDRLEAQRWRMQEERMAVVGKLAAGLAHEINNPLGAIALFTQHALRSIEPTHPLAEHLGTVLRNANLCKKVVRDLLEYARQRPPERREISLDELVQDVVRTLEPRAAESRVRIERLAANGAIRVHADPDQLRQILVNLGLNAIEAMVAGGHLLFRAGQRGESVIVEVQDDGPGIPEEERERIFAAFHTTKSEGTGLGLTVARDLAQAHGGTVEVETALGRGTTFTVVLPRPAAREPLERSS